MKSSQAAPTAVFAEREAMEDAVRALVHDGFPRQRIRISQGSIENAAGEVRLMPERGGAAIAGLAVGAVAGATAALTWTYWMSDLADIALSLIALRLLAGATGGALLGALIGFLSSARLPLREQRHPGGVFVVTVEPPNDSAANDVRAFLALHGGRLLPASP